MPQQAPELTISVVSHGQGFLIKNLLADIKLGVGVTCELIVTLNIPEDESFLSGYENHQLTVIRNTAPKGFGENHNQAFSRSSGNFFAVVNPDVRLNFFNIRPLLDHFCDSSIGVISPAVFSSAGELQDSARKFPTITSLILRKFGIQKTDYIFGDMAVDVEWVAGMFMVFSKYSYTLVKGFDMKYFMYMEDADICRRLSQHGLRVLVLPSLQVIHDARRASRHNIRHFIWHCRSTTFFFLSKK